VAVLLEVQHIAVQLVQLTVAVAALPGACQEAQHTVLLTVHVANLVARPTAVLGVLYEADQVARPTVEQAVLPEVGR